MDDMEQLRQGTGLTAYAQHDPKVEYRVFGFEMFEEMTDMIQEETLRVLYHVRLQQKVEREPAAKVTGTNKDDIYMYYCKKFLMKTIQVGEKLERIYNTSSKLNTEQMTQFLNNIQQDALHELGIRLPLPEDRFFEAFYSQFNY
jgi:preprotein translocase subunit SecA